MKKSTTGRPKKTTPQPPQTGSGQLLKEADAPAYGQLPENLTFQYLGGNQLMNARQFPGNDYEFIELINAGLPKQSFDHLAGVTGLPFSELAVIFNTTDRNLRRYDAHTKLNREQSERAIELARLYSLGSEVFGELNGFRRWIDSPLIALGGKKPKYFLSSSLGIGLLTKTLGRIQHGVFS